MPTFNQLVRKGERWRRTSLHPRSSEGFNTLKNRETGISSPRSAASAAVRTSTPKPNSALRKIARVRLSNRCSLSNISPVSATIRTPVVMIRGDRVRPPGVRYHNPRALDTRCTGETACKASKYRSKGPKQEKRNNHRAAQAGPKGLYILCR